MKKGRRKHVPQRTCVGCREILPKRSLIRIVRSPEGIQIDPTGKMPGRGAYLHDRRSCWERGLKGALAHALRTGLSEVDRERILKFMASLPEEESPGRTRSARTEPGRSTRAEPGRSTRAEPGRSTRAEPGRSKPEQA